MMTCHSEVTRGVTEGVTVPRPDPTRPVFRVAVVCLPPNNSCIASNGDLPDGHAMQTTGTVGC